jgi:Ca-activated chloride channel homolog
MRTIAILAMAFSLSSLWQQMTRPTNSRAANGRGLSAFEHQRYGDAAREFADVTAISPSSRAIFNRGTADVAAGRREEGSAALTEAMKDPSLRADAFFNRGNSALASKAYEHAVRDYVESLKLRSTDAAAKRNLEIALKRLQAEREQQQRGGRGQQQQQQQQQQAPQQQPRPDEQKGEADAEALLRSVQQQEQEELARMKRARVDTRRVGW